MIYERPIAESIERRFSCRTYAGQPIPAQTQERLRERMASLGAGPFGTPLRFELVAATDEDHAALKGLGTYGFIRGATGFIVGAAGRGPKDLEDYGYAMEALILAATELNLGTCWLGGTFTRSRFARAIHLSGDDHMPAVTAIGVVADPERAKKGLVRRLARSSSRLPWETLFFDQSSDISLSRENAGRFARVLDLVQLAPSASNKQPWRIVKDRETWHFYLERTPGYGKSPAMKFLGKKVGSFPDIQRLDLGIAICHFDLASRELGLPGAWIVSEPPSAPPAARAEYTASFVSESPGSHRHS